MARASDWERGISSYCWERGLPGGFRGVPSEFEWEGSLKVEGTDRVSLVLPSMIDSFV